MRLGYVLTVFAKEWRDLVSNRLLLGAVALPALIFAAIPTGVVAFIQYVDRFFQPIRDLSEKYNTMQQAMASCERMFQILDEQPGVQDPAAPVRKR